MGGPDTPENKDYIQKHKLWTLGELITMHVIQTQPQNLDEFIVKVLTNEKDNPTTTIDPPSAEIAASAKAYLQEHRVAFVIEDWLRAVLEAKPDTPLDFSIAHFGKGSNAADAGAKRPKVLVLLYSTYCHCWAMAKAAVEGATTAGVQVDLMRIPETLPPEVISKMGAENAAVQMASIPTASVGDMALYDGLLFCFPAHFGVPPAQVQTFMDQTGGLWMSGALTGKPACALVSAESQHGGQELALLNFHKTLYHHGCIVFGIPSGPWFQADGVHGNSFYGASTVTGIQGERDPSEVDLSGARALGQRLSQVASKLRTTN